MNLQNYLTNYSFLTLLISVILIWMETSWRNIGLTNKFSSSRSLAKQPVRELLRTNTAAADEISNPNYIKADLTETLPTITKKLLAWPELACSAANTTPVPAKQGREAYITFTSLFVCISNALLTALLIFRWKESGHFPLSNLYESLMFLSWCFTGLYVVINTSVASLKDQNLIVEKFVGCVTLPCALFCNAFASFTLPKEMQEATPLVPALQSNWLMMHVTVMILSYAALILGSLISICFLIVSFNMPPSFQDAGCVASPGVNNTITGGREAIKQNPQIALLPHTTNSTNLTDLSQSKNLNNNFNNSWLCSTSKGAHEIALLLDNLSYRILALGFPLLTIGILSGAVWANEAWGSYWSWDPKETWAFLTWLVFAAYLHARLSKGWHGRKPALIASFGFLIVCMCYLGVNLIGEGLHSYGWMIKS